MCNILKRVLSAAVITVSVVLLVGSLALVQFSAGAGQRSAQTASLEVGIMDRHDMRMTNRISDALDGVLSIEKVYWLSDDV